jgi:hypothetical protein
MSYSDKFKVIWLNPMRTATRSCGIIQRRLGFEESATHKFLIPEDKVDYHYFLNIRNPYSRIVSLYKINCIWKKTEFVIEGFEPWVMSALHDDNRIANISTVHLDLLIDNLPKKPDVFVKIETLEDDLKKLWFIKDNLELLSSDFESQINNNRYINEYREHIPWQNFYNQELADFVYQKTQKQFEMFNYEKDSWKYGTS